MSVTLLLEVGNTAWKLASYQAASRPKFLNRGQGFEALVALLQTLDFDHLAVASVAESDFIEALRQFSAQYKKQLSIAETQTGFDVTQCYANPSTYGVDRWLTLLVARAEQTNAMIIDAGTAITLDVINEEGHHLGGWISPGFRLMQESLIQRSSKLRMTAEKPAEALGTSTEYAVYLGCQAALRGFVEQALQHSKHVFGDRGFTCYLTGGDHEHINAALLDRFNCRVERRPDLVLEGLARWYEQKPV
ncbi:MAG: type III pantothenate kinase [Aliidiomarina sp.]|uniref:type III pantothenate kinase n=1 Tax=Aliidiomarina sp. TaxID=1872439 RepID=UPI0025BA2000|nr:type III pantothenate kinase [Aliidiomarina sp.]MCH8502115.1 type III pantothenate kinase [Aliidiomarina sp.]